MSSSDGDTAQKLLQRSNEAFRRENETSNQDNQHPSMLDCGQEGSLGNQLAVDLGEDNRKIEFQNWTIIPRNDSLQLPQMPQTCSQDAQYPDNACQPLPQYAMGYQVPQILQVGGCQIQAMPPNPLITLSLATPPQAPVQQTQLSEAGVAQRRKIQQISQASPYSSSGKINEKGKNATHSSPLNHSFVKHRLFEFPSYYEKILGADTPLADYGTDSTSQGSSVQSSPGNGYSYQSQSGQPTAQMESQDFSHQATVLSRSMQINPGYPGQALQGPDWAQKTTSATVQLPRQGGPTPGGAHTSLMSQNSAPGDFTACSVQAARAYPTQGSNNMLHRPNAVHATQASRKIQQAYHPAIKARNADDVRCPIPKPAARKYLSKLDAFDISQTLPLDHPFTTTATPGPSFVSSKYGTRSNRKELTLGAVASVPKCMLCKVSFGEQSSHGSHRQHVKLPGNKAIWVEVKNQGTVEIPIRLPCGHVAGNNCIIAYYFCPRCQCPLYFSCGHPIPLRPTDPTTIGQMADMPSKCIQCRILDFERSENLSSLLAQLGSLKEQRDMQCSEGEREKAIERKKIEESISQLQRKVDGIEAETGQMIEAAQYYGYY